MNNTSLGTSLATSLDTSLATSLATSLEKDIQLLKESMDILHETVSSQQNSLHTLEDAIYESQYSVAASHATLDEASSYSSSYYTVIGAIGTVALGILFII